MSSENITTRIRILQSTRTLLEKSKGGAVSMSDIARAAKISRQALYLHFPNRAELLVATTRYLDEIYDIDAKLLKSRSANSGLERLDAWVEVWGNYIPKIYSVAKALFAMKNTDKEAMIAWNERMQAVRFGCAAAVSMLVADEKLRDGLTKQEATDILWTLMSVHNWQQLRHECGWSQRRYIEAMKTISKQTLVDTGPSPSDFTE
jgi:AcrR family transcriptional regulator